jgi:hypothetical protein
LFILIFKATHWHVLADVEKLLVDIGAVKLGDQRLQKKKDPADAPTSKIRQGKTTGDDEDSDWDWLEVMMNNRAFCSTTAGIPHSALCGEYNRDNDMFGEWRLGSVINTLIRTLEFHLPNGTAQGGYALK